MPAQDHGAFYASGRCSTWRQHPDFPGDVLLPLNIKFGWRKWHRVWRVAFCVSALDILRRGQRSSERRLLGKLHERRTPFRLGTGAANSAG